MLNLLKILRKGERIHFRSCWSESASSPLAFISQCIGCFQISFKRN